MNKVKEIEFDLLENGLDFILNSLKPILESKNELELKYSVLHISAGTELILKEILRKEHWSLIFEKVDSANNIKLRKGDFQSVNFDTILIRLKNIAGVTIKDDEINYIKNLRKTRNRIEHFEFQENVKAIKSNVSNALSQLIDIIKQNINITEYSLNSQELYKSILQSSAKFDEFKDLTYSKLSDSLQSYEKEEIKIVECPECFHKTLPLDGFPTCLFCDYNDDPENIAHSYLENILGISEYAAVKDGGYFPLDDCPDCNTRTLYCNYEDDIYLCFKCGNEWTENEIAICERCNGYYLDHQQNQGYCEDCNSIMMENHWK